MATRTKPPIILNLTTSGPELEWKEMTQALCDQRESPAIRAIMQILDFHLSCSRGHELLPQAPASARDYGAGAANLAVKVITEIQLLTQRQLKSGFLSELKERFSVVNDEDETAEEN